MDDDLTKWLSKILFTNPDGTMISAEEFTARYAEVDARTDHYEVDFGTLSVVRNPWDRMENGT